MGSLHGRIIRVRVALFAPHYAEYAARMSMALASADEVLLVLDKKNRRNELQDDLYGQLKQNVRLFEFRSDTRLTRRVARLTVSLRILLFRPDIVHVQEQPDQLSAVVVSILKWFYPIVLTVHDPKPHAGRDTAYAMRWGRYRRTLRDVACAYHVHGEYCAALMRSENPSNRRIVSTLHGVILTPDPNQLLTSEPGRVLFFGRMEQYKGLDVLLQSASALAEECTGIKFVLAGRGPELDRLRSAVEGLGNLIVIHRYLTPAEVIAEFQRAALVVLPYTEATQSGVLAAAFANGRPVIASQVGGLVEVVHDGINGLLVQPKSAEALTRAIVRVAQDDVLRISLAEGARRAADINLNWQIIADHLREAYSQALNEHLAA